MTNRPRAVAVMLATISLRIARMRSLLIATAFVTIPECVWKICVAISVKTGSFSHLLPTLMVPVPPSFHGSFSATVAEDNPPSLEVPNPVSDPEELSSQIAETNDTCIPSQADLANSES